MVILSGGSSSSSTRDGNMAHGVEERGGRGQEATFYVQAMLKDRSGAVWMGVEFPSFSASSGSSSDSSSSPATSTSSSISSPPEEGSIETSALRMEFTRSDAAVILFCGEHSKVYKVEVWEDMEKVRAVLESEEEKEVVVERGEDGVVRVGLFVGAGEEGETQVDEEEDREGKKGRAGEEEEVVVD